MSSEATLHALTEAQKQGLLRLARNTIATKLTELPPPLAEVTGLEEVYAGAFVSLHIDGRLRGCIGFVEGLRPLPEVVQEMALAAAFRDPRFDPLTEDELDKVEIEISVMSPLRRIQTINEIELGKHGVMIRSGNHQGLLLPQVATHGHWDVETFLAHVCLKAGLLPETWKDPETEIYIFEAEVFSDSTLAKTV
jgi:AmmeMemoRadiSam system protein A